MSEKPNPEKHSGVPFESDDAGEQQLWRDLESLPQEAPSQRLRRRFYENSLLLVMGAIFFASWAGQSLGNWRTFNEDRAAHDLPEVGWATYVRLADFCIGAAAG